VWAAFLVACGSSSTGGNPATGGQDASMHEDSGAVDASAIDGFAGAVTEHGIELDYATLKPVAGLTVSDNGMSSTTDATGAWSIMLPAGTATLTPTVSGPSYSETLFPQTVPAAADVDFGQAVSGTSSIYAVELEGLTADMTKGLVQVVVVTASSCASSAGGTLQVLSPSGASVVYFSTTSLPDDSLTSFQAVTAPRPVAVVYDIALGENLTVSMTHPTCTQAPFPFTYGGRTYTGVVPMMAAEPGDYNSAMVLMLE
jgi:hypothetical protein